ncbi:MAG: hypothetical protein AAB221_04970 [Bacteroidota bacterium]
MKKLLSLVVVASLISCNFGTKTEVKVKGKQYDRDTTNVIKKDTNPPLIITLDTSGVDKSNFGPIKLGQYYGETQEALGPPDTKSKAIEWAADGMLHEDWTWKKNGLVLNMSSYKETKDVITIHSITAMAPCTFITKAGLGIGSTYAEVEAAYKKDIDTEATDKTQITVGSVYGGIIFTFKNNKAERIFLGAAAE